MFAAVSSGLLRFSEWREKQRLWDKLLFGRIRVQKQLNKAGRVTLLRFGFELHNRAVFPIQFDVQDLHTQAGDLHPPKKPYPKPSITVGPDGKGWFDDFTIEVRDPIKSETIKASVDFRVKYGRPSRLNHELSLRHEAFLVFDAKGDMAVDGWMQV